MWMILFVPNSFDLGVIFKRGGNMPEKELNVKLIQSPDDPIRILYSAARQCYSKDFVGDYNDINYEKAKKLIKSIIKSGHISIIEHLNYTFAIEGISRSESHQHVRHRIASFSQQSQRYCNAANNNNEFNYIIPPSIKNNSEALEVFIKTMMYINEQYKYLTKILSRDIDNGEKVNQDARYVLPNACETKFVTTMNASSLMHFFELRLCKRAQWEIRSVAKKMLNLCKDNCSVLFDMCGPKCKKLGYCPEGIRSCGMMPTE